MTNEEVRNLPPEVRRWCPDCRFMYARVNWWYVNKKAIDARGTAIPGVHQCPYWELDEEYVKEQKKKQYHPSDFKDWLRRNAIEIYFIATILVCALVLWLGLYLQYSK